MRLYVRAPPPGPLRRGVVPLTGYPPSSQGFLSPPWARTWDHELRYPFEVVPTTNWASSSVGSENYLEWVPFFVRAPPLGPLRRGVVPLTGYPPSSQGFLLPPWARTWDHELRYPFEVVPTTNWASSSIGSENYLEWVPFFVRAPPPGPLRRGVVPLTGYPPSSQGFLSPPWA